MTTMHNDDDAGFFWALLKIVAVVVLGVLFFILRQFAEER